jgi:hypothetical protein
VSVSLRTAKTASPAESEIAAIAYRLWQANGCLTGSDREDWFRAEAMLRNALVAKCDDLSRRLPISRFDTRPESGIVAALQWEVRGHWEVWEMEWGGARWIWDRTTPSHGISNRAG